VETPKPKKNHHCRLNRQPENYYYVNFFTTHRLLSLSPQYPSTTSCQMGQVHRAGPSALYFCVGRVVKKACKKRSYLFGSAHWACILHGLAWARTLGLRLALLKN